jgi:hypothetical protein
MGFAMRPLIVAIAFILIAIAAQQVRAQPMTANYDQKTLLKNWTLSVCLAQIAQDVRTAEDAGLTASAYLEYGHQGVEAYDELRKLVGKYKNLKYGGSVKAEYNTMKCIDLFHSKELERLTARLASKG